MMIDLCNRLVDNNLTRDELLPHIEIVSTTYGDAPALTELLAKCFNLPFGQEEALRQLLYSNAQLDNSVKVVDKRNGDIYGFLIFSMFPLHIGSPIMHENARLGGFLIQFKQINGHSFILDERLRGTGIDKKMLYFKKDFLDEFDLIWCAVESTLKTNSYWKRLGFKELFKIPQATFYVMFNKKTFSDDIYNITGQLKDEEDYNKRTSGNQVDGDCH